MDGATPRALQRGKWTQFTYKAKSVKNPPANVGDMGSIPGSGRSPGEGNGNPFQYYCLENPMDRGGWRATVPEVERGARGTT